VLNTVLPRTHSIPMIKLVPKRKRDFLYLPLKGLAALLAVILFSTAGFSQTWTGSVSTAWENPANWSTGAIPTITNDVTIPSSPSGGRFPTISTGTQGVKAITIQAGATVTMTGGTLQLEHDWKNSGTFNASGGTLQIIGAPGAGGDYSLGTNNFFHVTVNAGIDAKFSAKVGAVLNIAGNYTNNNSGLTVGTNATFNFNGSGDQTIYSASSNNDFGYMIVNKSGGTLSLSSTAQVAANLTLTAGTFSTSVSNHSLIISGSANFDGGSFVTNASTITVTGSLTTSGGTITGGACTVNVTGDFTRTGGSFSAPTGAILLSGNFINNGASGTFNVPVHLNGTFKTISGSTSNTFTSLIVGDGASYTMNNSNTCSSLVLAVGSLGQSLAIATGTTLTVNGDITINQPTASKIVSLNVDAGTVTVNGNVNIGGSNTSTGRVAKVVITTGTLNINGNLVYNCAATTPGTAVLDMIGGAGNVNLTGNVTFTNGSGTLTAGTTSTFTFNGTSDQYVASATDFVYNILRVNKSSGTLYPTGNLSLGTGSLKIDAGTFSTTSNNYSVTAKDYILNGGTFTVNNSTITATGSWTNSGTSVSGGTSYVISGDYTRNGGSLSAPSATLSVGGNWSNNTGNSFSVASVTFTGTSKAIGGTTSTSFPALNITTGTVTLNTSSSCTSLTLANNTVANSITITSGVTLTVNGNIAINQATANAVVHALNVNAGTVTVNGNITFSVSTNNSGRTTRIAITTGTLNVNGNIAMNNTLLAANSVIDMSGGAGNLNLTGSFNITSLGTLTPGTTSTFTYNGTTDQSIAGGSAISYNHLRINKASGAASFTGNLSLSGNLVVDAGTLTTTASNYSLSAVGITLNGGSFSVNNSSITASGNLLFNGTTVTGGTCSLTISGDVTFAAGSYTAPSSTISVGGNWVNNMASAVSATSVTFTGTAKTIGGTATSIFPSVNITTGTVTLNTNATCTALTLANNNVNNSLTISSGVSLTVNGDVVINQSSGGTIVHTLNVNSGTLTITGNLTFSVLTNNSGRTAKLAITTGTCTVGGDVIMNNTVLAANSVIDMSGGAGTLNLGGNFTVSSLGTLTPGTSSTVVLNGTGAQTLTQGSSVSYHHLTVNKSSGTASISAALSIGGTLTVAQGTFSTSASNFSLTTTGVTVTGGTLSLGNSSVTINGNVLTSGGSINAGTSAMSVSGNWTNNGGTISAVNVTFTGAAKTIGGTSNTSFGNITFGSSATYTLNSSQTCTGVTFTSSAASSSLSHASGAMLTVNGNVLLNSPNNDNFATDWNVNAGSALVTGNVTLGSLGDRNKLTRLFITTGTVTINGNLLFNPKSDKPANAVVDMSGGAGTLNLKGAITMSSGVGTLTPGTTSTVNFNGSSAQSIAFPSLIRFNNININNTAGVTASAAFTSTLVTGNVRVQTGIFNNGGFAIAGATGKTFEVANGATFNITGTSAMVTGFTTKTFGATSTVNYGGTTQTVSGETYGHLTISGSGTKTMGASSTVEGTLTLTAGTFTLGAYTLTLNSLVSVGSGTMTGGCTSNITIGGVGESTTLPGLTVNNLTINRPNGIFIGGDMTVCGTLTFTTGHIRTNDFVVIINSTGTVSRTSGHVIGNLRKNVATGATSRTFEIGGSNYYTPVLVSFASVTTAGNLTAKVTAGDHANITSSTVSILKSAARHWTLTNSGIVFTNYSATFNFNSADLDAIANTSSFIVGRYASSTWSYPTVGTKTSTSTQATGLTGFGDFQVGEYGSNAVKTWTGGAGTTNWGDANNWSPSGVPVSTDIVDLGSSSTIAVNVNASASELRLYHSGLTLTINSGNSLTIGSNLTINSGTLNIASSFPSVSGSVLITGGTVGFTAASGSQTVPAYDYVNLTISGGGTKTLAGNISPSGDLNISGGTFDLGSYTCNRSAAGGTLTVANGATIKIGGTNTRPINYTTHSFGSTSTVEYSGTNQTIRSLFSSQNYGSLIISGSGTKTLDADISVGSLTINSGTLATAGKNITISGNWVNNSSFDAGAATVTFNGTTTISGSSSTTFNHVVVSGTLTASTGNMNISGNFTNNGTFTHNSGTITFNGTTSIWGSSTTNFNHLSTSGTVTAPSGTMNVAGNWTNTGTFNHNSGTVNFNGSGSQTMPAASFNNLTSSSSGARILPSSGTLSIEGTFTPGTNSYTVTGSTIEFNSSGAQNIPAFTYNNISIAGAASTTKSATGNLVVQGLFSIIEGVTMDMQTFTLSGSMVNMNGTGTFRTQSTSSTPLPSGVTYQVPVYYNSASAQTIVAGDYTDLIGTGGNRTLSGVVGIAGTFTPGSGTYTIAGSTVHFNGNIAQSIPTINYNHLSVSGASTTKTASGNLVVDGVLTVNGDVTLDMVTNVLSGSVTSVAGTGIVRTQNTGTTPLPSGKTWTCDVEYNSSSAQTIVAGNYTNLNGTGGARTLASGTIGIAETFTPGGGAYTVTGSTVDFNGTADQNIPVFTFNNLATSGSGTAKTADGNLTVNGSLTVSTNVTLDMSSFTLAGSLSSIAGTGTIKTANTSSLPVPSGKNWTCTVEYNNLTGSQTIVAGTYATLRNNNTSGENTAGGLLTVESLLLGTNSVLNLSSYQLAGNLFSITGTGYLKTQNTSATPLPSGKVWSGTVEYNNATGGQTVVNGTYGVLINSNTSGTNTTSGSLVVNETLTLNAGSELDLVTYALTGTVSTITGTGTLKTQNTSATPIPVDKTWTATIHYNGSSTQTIVSGDYTNLNGTGGNRILSTSPIGIAGTFTPGAGTYTITGSSIDFNGAAPQNIPEFTFFGLTVSGGSTKSVAGSVTIKDGIRIGDNTTLALGNNNITLKSDSLTNARVGNVASTASITYGTGRFVVERWVQGRRKYRLITSSVTTSPNNTLTAGEEALSIWGNWQNGGVNTSQNIGTWITGGTSADGYDAQTANASLFTYDDVNRRFVGFTSANGKNTKYTPLKAGVGYYMFVYGDRQNSITTSNPRSTVLKSTGKIVTGDQQYTTSSAIPLSGVTDRWTLIGNPYACVIDWKTIAKVNLSNTIWGWDANMNSSGGYVTVTRSGSSTIVAPVSDLVKVSRYIQPGQAFFVKTTGANPELLITESDKVDSSARVTNSVFRSSATDNMDPFMAINVIYQNSGTKILADGIVAAFSSTFSNQVNDEDAAKMSSSNESIAIVKGSQLLSIETKQMPMHQDTMHLNIARFTRAHYTLQVFFSQMNNMSTIPYLLDNYLNTATALSVSDTNNISISINSADPLSSNANRFKIVFKLPSVVPVTITSMRATQVDRNVRVDWNVATESGISNYQVEHSSNGSAFANISSADARNSGLSEMYRVIHNQPVQGQNYYRIRVNRLDGSYYYSSVAVVILDARNQSIQVYPNPVVNHVLNLQITGYAKGNYTLMLYNLEGRLAFSSSLNHQGGSGSVSIPLNSGLARGMYQLKLVGDMKHQQTILID
jgi:hypothetical protein